MLTDTHQQLIRGILKDMTVRSKISPAQRAAIRQCCVEAMPVAEPEKLLIAFKSALAAAAEAEQIPAGVERNAMLSQLVSIFIDELYATRNDDSLPEISLRKETPASAPRLVLDNDSINTHL
jgi:hypothetical protein